MTEEEIHSIKAVLLRWFDQNEIEANGCSREIAAALDRHREGMILSDPERDRRNESKGLEGAGRPF